jgi:hypothetical protein
MKANKEEDKDAEIKRGRGEQQKEARRYGNERKKISRKE